MFHSSYIINAIKIAYIIIRHYIFHMYYIYHIALLREPDPGYKKKNPVFYSLRGTRSANIINIRYFWWYTNFQQQSTIGHIRSYISNWPISSEPTKFRDIKIQDVGTHGQKVVSNICVDISLTSGKKTIFAIWGGGT